MLRSWRGRAIGTLIVAVVAIVGLIALASPVVASTDATLVVAVVGTGSVFSEPPGMTCPGNCVGSFPVGTKIALVAKPSQGSVLLRWGGACTGTGACKVTLTPLTVVAAQFTKASGPAPVGSGLLTSGEPVSSDVTSATGVTFRLVAVTGHHLTLAISNPHTSPPGARLQINVYDSSGANDTGGAAFSTGPTEIDFTPTSDQAGPTTVVISPYDGGTTGSFDLTYAADVIRKLQPGVPVQGTLQWEGQHAVYTFTAVTGRAVSLAITNPNTAPPGARLQINVYDSSGANDTGGAAFSTSPAEIDFTPTSDQAGPTTVVVSPYDGGATGSYTLTYKASG